jgi:hypothetical protein
MKTTSRKKRTLLLQLAREEKDLREVNKALVRGCMDPIVAPEWELWISYYEPMSRNNPLLEQEIIINDRSLAWLAEQECNRANKKSLS